MKKKKYRLQKDLTLLSFSLFVIVTIWILLTLYGVYVKNTINDTLQKQIIPIEGKFDSNSITDIKNRITIQPDYSASVSAQTFTIESLPEIPTPTKQPSVSPGITPETLTDTSLSPTQTPTVQNIEQGSL